MYVDAAPCESLRFLCRLLLILIMTHDDVIFNEKKKNLEFLLFRAFSGILRAFLVILGDSKGFKGS